MLQLDVDDSGEHTQFPRRWRLDGDTADTHPADADDGDDTAATATLEAGSTATTDTVSAPASRRGCCELDLR